MENEHMEVGKLTKVHGLNGELKFFIRETFEEWMEEQDHFYINLGNQMVPFFVEQVRGSGVIIKLEDVNTPEEAADLANKTIYVKKALVPAELLGASSETESELPFEVGYIIFDKKRGEIGVIKELIEMPMQLLAAVDYKKKEILIPIHEHLIVDITPHEKILTLDLPEGLLDL